jgi:hypothetical protein
VTAKFPLLFTWSCLVFPHFPYTATFFLAVSTFSHRVAPLRCRKSFSSGFVPKGKLPKVKLLKVNGKTLKGPISANPSGSKRRPCG